MNESSEEFKALKAEWHKIANEMTLEKLPVFIDDLNKCQHDYGTVCHATAIAGLSASQAMARHHGITGFQAGCVMWEFIRGWMYSHNKTGLKLVDYDKMLYPQYDYYFDKTISSNVFTSLQEEAVRLMSEADMKYEKYLINTDRYLVDLSNFMDKYPDYADRKEHYDHLGMGTYEEHREYERRLAHGFEFAPRKPYCLVTPASPIYKHWEKIANGMIPFGYEVKDE